MINKIIHYCWFGDGKKSETVENCIKSWKALLPDYKIIEWNETNSDLSNEFSKKAFKYKKWAFLSDYVRLKVLFEHGGIYLDTDMLVVRSFDDLLHDGCFLGYQDNGQINGSIIGCEAGDRFMAACLDKYDHLTFDQNRLMSMAIPELLTQIYADYSDKNFLKLYPYEVFYPYKFNDSLSNKNYLESIKPETYTVHLWNASWFTEKEMAGFAFEHKKYAKGLRLFLTYLIRNPGALLNIPGIIFRKIKAKD